jgi:serine/threonine protein kinase
MNEPETKAEAVVRDALEHSPDEREVFVSKTCGTDESLHQQVRRLLEALRADTAGEQIPLTPTVEADLLRLRPEEPGDSIGPYKLREQLGAGRLRYCVGCGSRPARSSACGAEDHKLGMDTAEVIARFEQERQALALMDHPSIAKVFDGGATPTGRPYFVMELVHGSKLTDYCDSRRLSLDERLELFIQVCNAVQHAHQKGIVHRDLKPSNILVTTSLSDAALPKVIGFGVATTMHPVSIAS